MVLVFVDRLEGCVVSYDTVRESKAPRICDAFLGLLALHHLGVEKELLNLFPAQGWLVRRHDKNLTNQKNHCGKNQPPPFADQVCASEYLLRIMPTNLALLLTVQQRSRDFQFPSGNTGPPYA